MTKITVKLTSYRANNMLVTLKSTRDNIAEDTITAELNALQDILCEKMSEMDCSMSQQNQICIALNDFCSRYDWKWSLFEPDHIILI